MEEDLKIFTYNAPTRREAMDIVKQIHGEDALIINTREVKKKSLLEAGIWEIVVATPKVAPSEIKSEIKEDAQEEKLPQNSIQRRIDEIAQKTLEQKRAEKARKNEELRSEFSAVAREISKIATQNRSTESLRGNFVRDFGDSGDSRKDSSDSRNSKDSRQDSRDSKDSQKNSESKSDLNNSKHNPIQKTREMLANLNANEARELNAIKSSLNRLDDKMKLLQDMFYNDMGLRAQSANIPQEFAEIYRICKSSGMKNEHLDEIMQLSQEHMPYSMRENSKTIKRYFREVLRKMIMCRSENIDMKRKRIIMLVGPTGVGKTTTIAKLAAHYALNHKYKVGLITLDSYRIGAFEQLAFYAKKLKLSINQVSDTGEFESALEDLKYCDFILIDTIGSSQNDKQKLEILRRFARSDYNIDVNLMLSATTKFEDLRDIYNAFGILNIDTLIFSKLDESKGFGNVFSLLYEAKKPVSYFTIGQEVPEDILVAKNDYLADCIINGFYKPERKAIIR